MCLTLCSFYEKFCISKNTVNLRRSLLHKGKIKGCVRKNNIYLFYHFRFAFPMDAFHSVAFRFRAGSKSDFQKTVIRISWGSLLKIKQKNQQILGLPPQINRLVISEAWETNFNKFPDPSTSPRVIWNTLYIYGLTFCVVSLVGGRGRGGERERD